MNHTILCVDDEPDTVDSLGRLFRKKYKILKAVSGVEALDLLKKNRDVSLIISDQRMPEMTGVEFLSQSLDFVPDAMRILLTGYTDIDSVIGAINSGQIYRYITKPWDPVDLMATVDQAIEKYELRAELKVKNAKLEQALNELQSLDQAKSNFMILINHELKTPLTTMLSFLHLLKESKLSDEQELYIARVSSSADRLQSLIDNVLLLVKAETGVIEMNKQDLEAHQITNDIVKSLIPEAQKRSVTISQIGELKVHTDKDLISRVINNLADNAVKFSREGGTVEIRFDENSVSISNDGPELSDEKIATLLKPFTLDENILNHSQGLGLGLSQTQAILKCLGSELSIQSADEKTTVSFQISN